MRRILHLLNKPEYVFNPSKIFSRARQAAKLPAKASVALPWGVAIRTANHDTITNSLKTMGIYELSVSEMLWRLTELGSFALDVGGNIGYMTSILACRAGKDGAVTTFEPHPDLFQELASNIAEWQTAPFTAKICAKQAALGSSSRIGSLAEPEGFQANHGIATIACDEVSSTRQRTFQVTMERLDDLYSYQNIGVMKVDVEGGELAVFQGAERLLKNKRIRDIIFEDFSTYPSESAVLLKGWGYEIFRVGKGFWGPLMWPAANPTPASIVPWEPSNYLATLNPNRAVALIGPRGWKCLNR